MTAADLTARDIGARVRVRVGALTHEGELAELHVRRRRIQPGVEVGMVLGPMGNRVTVYAPGDRPVERLA